MPLTETQLAAAFKADPGLRSAFENIVAKRMKNWDGDTHDFYRFQPLPYQKRVLYSKKKIAAFCAGNQVGKSTIGGYWMATRLMGYDPLKPDLKFPGPGHYWACTKGDLIEGLVDKVLQFLPPHEVAIHRRGYGRQFIGMKNGRWLKFKSYDQPRSAFQQEALNDIWNDEEMPREIWQEQQTRLIRYNGQTLLSFTPVDGSVWIHELLFGDDADKWIDLTRAGMRENIHLPISAVEDYIRQFRDDKDQLAIRVEGDYRLMVGNKVFDNDAVAEAWKKTVDPNHRIFFDENGDAQTVEDLEAYNAHWALWRDPEPTHKYAIGADVAMGGIRGDWTTAYVFDCNRNEFVGRYRGKIDSYDWGDELVNAAEHFNHAMLCPEINGPGTATITRIQHLNYDNIFRRPRFTGSLRTTTPNVGWLTYKASKPAMVGEFQSLFAEGMVKIPDSMLLTEMRNFVWLRKDAPGQFGCAAASGHDDLVMAAMIAYQCSRGVGEAGKPLGLKYDEQLVAKIEESAERGHEEEDETQKWD